MPKTTDTKYVNKYQNDSFFLLKDEYIYQNKRFLYVHTYPVQSCFIVVGISPL
jgi:hypothetical protein